MKIHTKKKILISFLFLFFITSVSFTSLVHAQKSPLFTVVLDAGHGGKDPGKVYNGIYEKDIALKIVLLIGEKLKKYPNIKVIYTREDDTFVDLFERGAIANHAKADLFISVHCNAHNSQAHGAETYVLGLHANNKNFEVAKAENEVIYLEDNYEVKYADYNINSPESFIGLSIVQEEFLEQSIQLAKYIQDNFTKKMNRFNRGVKQAGFIVLHQTYMPSVLIETGFVTNHDERKFLTSSKGQDDFAENIKEAVLSYRDWIENKSIVTFVDGQNVKAETSTNTDLVYKIQISTGTSKIETKPYNFKGLSPISYQKSGKLYRYAYGETAHYNLAKKLLAKARSVGYADAFMVAFYKGEKITIAEALKIEKK